MIGLATPEIWLVCGSQHLYGPGPLEQVAAHAREIAGALADSPKLPLKTQFKALLTTPDEIAKLCLEANSDPDCAGLILWMHTFSPSKMWVRGLERAAKAVRASPYPVRSRPAVGHDRHGLHEPEPVGAWRPGGGLHPHAHASSRVKSSSAIGPIRRFRTASAHGCARRTHGPTGRARNSAASATTCARSRSPRATRSPPK